MYRQIHVLYINQDRTIRRLEGRKEVKEYIYIYNYN